MLMAVIHSILPSVIIMPKQWLLLLVHQLRLVTVVQLLLHVLAVAIANNWLFQ